jgi:uncharacterized DUF497 family protein
MITYQWNTDKNKFLKENRGVTFEQIVMHVENGDVIDIIDHPNAIKYSHQRVLIIKINEYVYSVPFVEENKIRFLKTIIPSRKLTKLYLR